MINKAGVAIADMPIRSWINLLRFP